MVSPCDHYLFSRTDDMDTEGLVNLEPFDNVHVEPGYRSYFWGFLPTEPRDASRIRRRPGGYTTSQGPVLLLLSYPHRRSTLRRDHRWGL